MMAMKPCEGGFFVEVGKSMIRVDAADKAAGRAKYTDDMIPRPHLVAKILHSTIANGRVKAIHTEEAMKHPGASLERGGSPPGRVRPEDAHRPGPLLR